MISPGKSTKEPELAAVTFEGSLASRIVGSAIHPEKCRIVPIHQIGQGMPDLPREEGHPSRRRPSKRLDDLFDGVKNEEVSRVPVFSAAAVGQDEIYAIDIFPDLLCESFHRDIGCVDFKTFRNRINVAKENEFRNAKFVTGTLHFKRTDLTEFLAIVAITQTAFAASKAQDGDKTSSTSDFTNQSRAEYFIIWMGDNHHGATEFREALQSKLFFLIIKGAKPSKEIPSLLPIE